jgi:uncharacterized membrane protein (DUF2068 family)
VAILKSGKASVRAVAVLEASKGVLVLAIGVGILSLINDRVWAAVFEEVTRHVYLNPSSRFAQSISDALADPSDTTLLTIAIAAAAYSTIRFIEAYGLWRGRSWAEWFGVISGLVYVPFEVIHLVRKPSGLSVGVLSINILIVAVLYRALQQDRPTKPTAKPTPAG